MKILAIETELKKLGANSDKEILKEEALAVLELQQKDILCEIYFDENHCAVLMLECPDKTEAGKNGGHFYGCQSCFSPAYSRRLRIAPSNITMDNEIEN